MVENAINNENNTIIWFHSILSRDCLFGYFFRNLVPRVLSCELYKGHDVIRLIEQTRSSEWYRMNIQLPDSVY